MLSEVNFINNKSLVLACAAEHDENFLISSGQDFTIELWFNSISGATGQTIFSKGISGNFLQNGGSDYSLYYFNNSSLDFYVYNISSGNPLLSVKNIIPNRWYHAAIVRNSGISKLYVNGIDSATNNSGWSANGTGNFYIGTNFFNTTDNYYTYNGYIDNFKFIKAAKYKNNFSTSRPLNDSFINNPIEIDKHFEKNILSLEMNSFHGDRVIVDNSINDFAILNSGVFISSEKSKFGGTSAFFSGRNSFLTIPSNSGFNIFNNDFTIDIWINPNTVLSNPYILKHHHTSGDLAGGWSLGLSGTRPFFKYGIGGGEIIILSSYALETNLWQQIAVSKNSDNIYLITDGTINAYRKMNETPLTGNSDFYIGTDPSGIALRTFSGFIDNIKITTGVAKYIPSFNIPNLGFLHVQESDPHFDNVSLLMYGNEMSGSLYFSDESRFGISRLGNGCGYFSGSNSTIFAPLSGIGSFGSGNFTLETWAKPLTLAQPNNFIGLANKASGLNSNNAWRLYISGSANNPVFEYTLNGSGNHKYVSGGSLNVYEWNHIAVVRSGELITFFVNGYSGNRLNISNDIIFNNNLALEIGRADRSSTVNNIFNGYLEDFRITNGIARYSSNFNNNLPIKYGDDINEDQYYNNVELLLHMNGLHNLEYIYDSSINDYRITDSGVLIKLNNDIVTNGTAITNSTLDSVFGGASIRGIGGSTSFLHIPSRCEFGNIGRNDFTVEWWDEILSWNSGYFPVLHYGNDGDYDTAKSRLGIYYSSSGLNLTVSMSGNSQNFPIYLSSAGIAQSGWRHNAITRRNGVVNLFINGIKHPSGYLMDYDISRGVNISTVGAGKYGPSLGSLYTMNGFIDDLRVTKNIARYIDDFSPPTEQFANF